ncbi:MAG: UPF0175 family protein [Anaerolineae bacterium]
MVETSFEIQVPKALLQFGLNQAEVQRRVTEWLVLSLFTEGRISSGKAAKLLKMNRIDFLVLLRTHGIAFIDYTPDELAEEFAAVETLLVKA